MLPTLGMFNPFRILASAASGVFAANRDSGEEAQALALRAAAPLISVNNRPKYSNVTNFKRPAHWLSCEQAFSNHRS